MQSLKRTLGFGLIISLTAIVLLQWLLVSITFREITKNYVVSRLQHEVDELLGSLAFDRNGEPVLSNHVTDEYDGRPYSGQYYRLQVDDHILRSSTLWDQDLNVERVPAGKSRQLRLPGPLDQKLLVLAQGFRKQEHAVTVAVAEDISAIDQQINTFQRNYFLLSAILLALLLMLQVFLVHRSLKPLQGVQTDLQKLGRGETSRVREEVPAEIRPLVGEVNRLLQLLNQRVERSRQMVGNLAHALKTPLSVLIRLSESSDLKDRPQTRTTITEQTRIIQNRLERELSRARLAGDSSSGRRFNPTTDLPALVNVLRQAYQDKKINLKIAEDAGTWPAEREDMLELIGNLLDNACKWAATRVDITLPVTGHHALTIDDDGPGLSAELHAQLGTRGKRFDEQTDGHGLGLAIASEIVEHYNGTLEFDTSSLGGLHVRINLP